MFVNLLGTIKKLRLASNHGANVSRVFSSQSITCNDLIGPFRNTSLFIVDHGFTVLPLVCELHVAICS